MLLAGVGVAQAQEDLVDLFLLPATQEVVVGQTFEIGLFARSQTSQEVPVGALSAVLDWDPTKLAFLGVRNTGLPYQWFSSGFNDDYDLNVSFTDGDAFYQALAQILPPAIPAEAPGMSTGGLLVTRFRLRALGSLPTQFAVTAQSDPPNPITITQVVHGTIPGLDITGNASSTTTIVPEPTTFTLAMITSIVLLGRRRATRRRLLA